MVISLEKNKRHISHLSSDSHTQSIVSSAEKCDLLASIFPNRIDERSLDKKMKLLIAEDEPLCLENLASLDWKSVGIDEVLTAKDGDAAYSIALSEKADIILSDIQMPKMSGLELADKLSVSLPESRFIILTAFNKFDYAQSAISSGVSSYILKPYMDEEILEAVSNAASAKLNDEKKNAYNEQITHQLETSKYFLLSYFLNTVSGKIDTDNQLNNIFKISESDAACTAMVVDLGSSSNGVFKENFRIFNHLINIFSRYNATVFPFFNITQLVFFFLSEPSSNPQKTPSSVLVYADAAETYLNSNYPEKWVIGLGNTVHDIQCCETSYKGALNAIKYRFYIGHKCIICLSDLEPSETLSVHAQFSYEDFAGYVKSGDSENAISLIKTLFNEFRDRTESIKTVHRICHEIIVHLSICVMQCGNDPDIVFNKTSIWDLILQYDSIDALEKFTVNIVDVVISSIVFRHDQKDISLVQEIKKYISENLDTSLIEIADRFAYTPNYISNIFSKKTGTTLKKYLTAERIKQAKILLADNNKSIAAIAEEVGYTSIPYFSTAFSKQTGMTPSAWRSSLADKTGSHTE